MKKIPVILCGCGFVGKAFIELLETKDRFLKEQYGLELECISIMNSKGGAFCKEGLNPVSVNKWIKSGKTIDCLEVHGEKGFNAIDAINKSDYQGVYVECSPTDLETGEPGLSFTRAALKKGWHVVIANKGPLVLAFEELEELSSASNVKLKTSGAAGAALPTVDVGEVCLAGSEIISFDGIFNGTTNYILTKMGDGEYSYDDALKDAQKMGIAEANPKLDVEGWDTACKTIILANTLMNTSLTLKDLHVEGITKISKDDIKKASVKNKLIKLIGSAERQDGKVSAEVRPVQIDNTSPFYGLSATDKGFVFNSDTLGELVVTGGASTPLGTAASMLKDLVNIYR